MKIRTFGIASLVLCALLTNRPAAAEMSLNVEKLSTNGMEVHNLSCKLQSGGLFGAMVIVAELAKYKKEFDRCAEAGAAFSTEFTWKGGHTKNAKVLASSDGDAKAEACVAATLKKTKTTVAGTCSAVLLTGDALTAQAAAAKLAKKE